MNILEFPESIWQMYQMQTKGDTLIINTPHRIDVNALTDAKLIEHADTFQIANKYGSVFLDKSVAKTEVYI